MLYVDKQNVVFCDIFDGEVFLVSCGRCIKYAKLDETMFNDDINSHNEFTTLNIEFSHDVEICSIINTSERKHIQIVAKDMKRKVMIVVTWNLEENVEAAMFQVKIEDGTRPENYVVKGMNQKFNYFIN